jgi:sensor histidine kinase YesM
MLPALSIQPIVENAIKHGLMPLDRGGSVRVTSWETPSAYCVSIEDDGVGFDTNILLDERKHIGLQNIRKRLEAMVGGSLTIESTIGKGTKVQLSIPKANI